MAPEAHECVIRTDLPKTSVKAENEAYYYSKVTVSPYAITPRYITQNILFNP